MLIDSENFTIYEVEELKNTFIKVLDESKIEIDMQNIKKIDMSAIQMLCSIKKSADESNKKFSLLNINSDISSIISLSGCNSFLGLDHG